MEVRVHETATFYLMSVITLQIIQKSTDGVVDFPCSSVYAEIRSVNMHVIQIVVRDSYARTIFVHALSKIFLRNHKNIHQLIRMIIG
jgi:hypothetical protein